MTKHNCRNLTGMLGLAFLASFMGCKTNQMIAKKVDKEFNASPILNKYFTGFAVYDRAEAQMIYQKNADKYFVPASNTKLFTFFAGLKVLKDSVPSLRYVERGDSLIFWGTGDPSLLHEKLGGDKALSFLKASNKTLFFASERYKGNIYGKDWAWDDYNEYYQPEISELPLYGNAIELSANVKGDVKIVPKSFEACFEVDSLYKGDRFRVQRVIADNRFYQPKLKPNSNYSQTVPFKTSTALTLTLLSNAIGKNVQLVNEQMPANAKTLYSSKLDDVLRQLMLPSDNFFAEQLLLTYADQLGVTLNADTVIKRIQKDHLQTLPDPPKWIDGSGLSKQNLFTPRAVVKLLDLIYTEVNDQERLFSLLPAGGKTGTLKTAYPQTDTPFVFAKTGTLSGVHNQSGYLVTKKGKLLIYSFMNNNFVQPTSVVRNEMVKLMTYIHDNF